MKRTSKPRPWSARKQRLFLEVVRQTGNISAAARAARMTRQAIYDRRRRDPEFAEALEEALDEALDDLEAELRRRAVEGADKPVFYGGKQCGTVRTYSDNVGLFLLKGRRREVFGEAGTRSKMGDAGATDEGAEASRKLLRKIAEMKARRGKD